MAKKMTKAQQSAKMKRIMNRAKAIRKKDGGSWRTALKKSWAQEKK